MCRRNLYQNTFFSLNVFGCELDKIKYHHAPIISCIYRDSRIQFEGSYIFTAAYTGTIYHSSSKQLFTKYFCLTIYLKDPNSNPAIMSMQFMIHQWKLMLTSQFTWISLPNSDSLHIFLLVNQISLHFLFKFSQIFLTFWKLLFRIATVLNCIFDCFLFSVQLFSHFEYRVPIEQ